MPGRPMYLYWIFPNRLLIQLRQPQQFVEKAKYEAVDLHEFENNLLEILRNFEQLLRTGH